MGVVRGAAARHFLDLSAVTPGQLRKVLDYAADMKRRRALNGPLLPGAPAGRQGAGHDLR